MSEHVAKFVLEEVKKHPEVETELVDARDYRMGATDNTETSPQAIKLEKIVNRADGFIIVSPEYNHGYPGELKMMLDLLYSQYAGKPVGICGVSNGPVGGARMGQQLRLVLIALHMIPVTEVVYFSFVNDLVDENGNFLQKDIYAPRVSGMLEAILWYARPLKEERRKKKE